MATRRNNPPMKPSTLTYVLSCAVVAALTLALLLFSEREEDACQARGGTQVRTSNGYVCATLAAPQTTKP